MATMRASLNFACAEVAVESGIMYDSNLRSSLTLLKLNMISDSLLISMLAQTLIFT